MIADVHIHLRQICELSPGSVEYVLNNEYSAVVSCHSSEDLEFALKVKEMKGVQNGRIYISYGVHPFSLDDDELKVLEKLIAERKIDAIGEIGLDRFSQDQKKSFEKQREFFQIQLNMAVESKMPVFFHFRKSFQEFFEYSKTVSKLSAAVFHSYSGTANEAESILRRGINAYFSFGTSVLNGHCKAIEAVSLLSFDKILIETDSPYQPLKNKEWTDMEEIELILLEISKIKKVDLLTASRIMNANFVKILTKI